MNITEQELEFLKQSNWIESEYSQQALEDAIKAWEYAKNNQLNLNYVLNIHQILLSKINPRIAGKIRNCDVYIGGHKKIFVSEFLIREDIIKCLVAMTPNTVIKTKNKVDEHTKKCHVYFEHIHPFEDGNGRVGRILYNVHRINLGLPLDIIHVGEEQKLYYKWFSDPKLKLELV